MYVRAFSIGGGRYMWSAVMLRGYFLMPKGGIMYRDGAAFNRTSMYVKATLASMPACPCLIQLGHKKIYLSHQC